MATKVLQILKSFGWKQWLVAAAFLLVVGFTSFYAYRSIRGAMYWRMHQDDPIEGWMTVGHIAHSYHVPPHVLYSALGLPNKPPDKRPLRKIARDQNRSLDDVKAILNEAIVHARPPFPPPTPPEKQEEPK